MPRFVVQAIELEGVPAARLLDAGQLAVAAVSAAGAMGLASEGAPITRSSPEEIAVALLCREGHIVLHAIPGDGACLVDLAARRGVSLERGLEVIARRLGATLP